MSLNTDPVIAEAIRLRDRVLDVGNEFEKYMPTRNPKANEMDAKTCKDAAAMLERLGIEVDRLRLTIGCFLHGRLERADLRRASESWNGDKP